MRPAHSHVPMRIRVLGLVVVASIALACGQVAALLEPAPADLLQKANTNLKAAKTKEAELLAAFRGARPETPRERTMVAA